MANIILNPWGETPAEKALRLKGFNAKDEGVMETGLEFSADLTRKENVGHAMQKFARAMWELRQAMADRKWDDAKCMVVMGIQIRNGWEQDGDGEWMEVGSPKWLEKQIKK